MKMFIHFIRIHRAELAFLSLFSAWYWLLFLALLLALSPR